MASVIPAATEISSWSLRMLAPISVITGCTMCGFTHSSSTVARFTSSALLVVVCMSSVVCRCCSLLSSGSDVMICWGGIVLELMSPVMSAVAIAPEPMNPSTVLAGSCGGEEAGAGEDMASGGRGRRSEGVHGAQ